MAKYVVKTPQITVNDVDLSAYLEDVTLTYEADEIESTSSGTTVNDKSFVPGLRSWGVDATLQQDYAAGKVDATLFPLIGADAFTIKVKPSSAATGATNPEFSGDAILLSYPPVTGKVGELARVTVKFRGSGALSRGVA
jgi:hypothetical protein